MQGIPFAVGSTGPKVEAARRFVAETRGRAAIGALADLGRIVAGESGTTITRDTGEMTLA